MPHRLRAQIHDFLHEYRRQVFDLEHAADRVEDRKERARMFADELLDQKFHYHFHTKVDEHQAATIQLIHNYCREALLPPILGRLAEREALIEQRHKAALELVEKVMESFAEEVEAHEA